MKILQSTGKTVEEAIESALKDLGGISREKVEIEVLEEGSRGLFGLLGTKLAVVKVSVKESKAEKAQEFLTALLDKMYIKAEVNLAQESDKQVLLDIIGEDLGNLIGRRGQTLDSLQYLVNLAVNKGSENKVRIIVDVSGYRQRREQTLHNLALRLAERVKQKNESITLEPMNAHERRVIHLALQDNAYVYTQSKGEDPERKIVICPKK